MNMNCEVCGKPDQNEHEDFCYGCGHILCTDCCHDLENDDIIGSPHNIRTHQRAFHYKVELGTWLSFGDIKTKKA